MVLKVLMPERKLKGQWYVWALCCSSFHIIASPTNACKDSSSDVFVLLCIYNCSSVILFARCIFIAVMFFLRLSLHTGFNCLLCMPSFIVNLKYLFYHFSVTHLPTDHYIRMGCGYYPPLNSEFLFTISGPSLLKGVL